MNILRKRFSLTLSSIQRRCSKFQFCNHPLGWVNPSIHNISITATNFKNFSTISSSINFESEENLEKKSKIFRNPDKVPSTRKLLRDIVINTPKKVKEFRKIIGANEEDWNNSLRSLGIPDDKNYELRPEEMEVLALEYDYIVCLNSKKENFILRPPVITIMGHVDHGKTTLLDSFRNSNIAEGEFGGITQKIGAFMVKSADNKWISVIDTPGHEAFSNMRKRGANCTDVVILVVSAIDGCQPQTFEVIEHARAAGVPLIVAINKIDRGGNPEEIEKELNDYGLELEPYGGNIPVVHISAKFKKNLDLLEELILFEAELMDLRANPNAVAEGIILESKRTTESESKACTIIVQNGTLKAGDIIVAGTNFGKVRQIKDDRGNVLKEAGPSYAVEIIGLKELPDNGDPFFVVSDETRAKIIAHRRNLRKSASKSDDSVEEYVKGTKIKFSSSRERRAFHSGKKEIIMSKFNEVEAAILEKIELLKGNEDEDSQLRILELEDELNAQKQYYKEMVDLGEDDETINLIVKAQDKGTLETLLEQIKKIFGSNPEFKVEVLSSSVGNITESDIRDADQFNAMILGMDIRCPSDLESLVRAQKIQIKTFKLIYDVLDEIKAIAKKGGVKKLKEEIISKGSALIKQVFEVKLKSDKKKVAGLSVTKGLFSKKFKYKLLRGNKVIVDSLTISSLKFHKEEVNEIKKGQDCGLSFFEYQEFKEGDQIEAYEVKVLEKN